MNDLTEKIPKIDKKKLLIIVLVVAFVLIGGIIVILVLQNSSSNNSNPEDITYAGELTYWGLWEPESVMESIIESYEELHPGVTINYVQKSFSNYEDNLYGILEEGASSDVLVPDIFRIGNSWLPKYQKYLTSVPSSIMSTAEYEESFYPTIIDDFIGPDGKIYAIPWSIDGLAIFYNKQLLEEKGYSEPPTDWDSFVELAQELTVRNSNTGEITQAGLSVGTSENVLHSESILSYLFLLNGLNSDELMPSVTEIDLTSTEAEVALDTYASFTNSETGTWSSILRTDLELFYEGKLAMMFAPSWRAFDIIEAAPSIEFGIATTPQLPGNTSVYYSMYWGEAVSTYCENQALAWDFVAYLASEEIQQELYSNASVIRAFGEPYSLRSLQSLLLDGEGEESYTSAIVEMAPYMEAWHMGDQYFVEDILNEAITNVIEYDMEASTALGDAEAEINDQLAESNN